MRIYLRTFHIKAVQAMLVLTGLHFLSLPLPAWSGPLPKFSGQVSVFGTLAPDNQREALAGGRYIPELSMGGETENGHLIDMEASANIYGTAAWHLFDDSAAGGDVKPYRIWGRYSTDQFEARMGLQKINFGSAAILRPLMWFDQLDPRDPLQLTDGVYGLLGRYFFLNNANVWLWGLWGNDDRRGSDLLPGDGDDPEFGGRIQYPVPGGEMALAFHHRTADASGSQDGFGIWDDAAAGIPGSEGVEEYRLGLDGKWDVTVGVWFETTWIHRKQDLGRLTDRFLYCLGTDYTFGIGNGLTLTGEHLVNAFDDRALGFSETRHASAASLSYPLSVDDRVSCFLTWDWESREGSFFVNLEHQFQRFTGYIMAFYNPDTRSTAGDETFTGAYTGPGIRIMVVYDY